MSTLQVMSDAAGATAVHVGARGRAVRLAAALLVLALSTTGAIWGNDDAFPAGPFRMYSTRAGLDAPVNSTRIEGVDATGHRLAITDVATGLRRAEIEGQTGRFIADPALLGLVAASYARRNPDLAPLTRVEVIRRGYVLRGGQRTGDYDDTVLAAWADRAP